MDEPRKIIIVAALPFEGACIRRYLDLAPSDDAFPAFAASPYHLIVSGVGKVRAAAATGALCSRFPPDDIGAIVNIGIAGSVSANQPVHSHWLIHQIRDAATGRNGYPDMLASHRMSETTVTTLDRPATAESSYLPKYGLVDMEASGFFDAAAMFVGPEKIICAKTVSDMIQSGRTDIAVTSNTHAAKPNIDISDMSAVLENALPGIFQYVHATCECNAQTKYVPFSNTHRKYIKTVTDMLQLTRTQQEQLRQTVSRFIHKNPEAPLPEVIPVRVTTARERNHYFAQFQQKLLR